jgi:Fic family protein
MLRNGYWLTEFLTISRILKAAPSQYARSFLLTEDDEGDLTYFFIYHLGVVNRSITDLHAYLAQKAKELRLLQQSLRSGPTDLNHRQLALLDHALRNPEAVFTADSHANSHRVSGMTSRHDLGDLEERGFIQRFKLGRKFAWAPAPDLGERLRG